MGGYCRVECRESGVEKGALAITLYRRYSAEEKALILEKVERTRERTGRPVQEILVQLGLPAAT